MGDKTVFFVFFSLKSDSYLLYLYYEAYKVYRS